MGFTIKKGSEKRSQKGFWEGGEFRRCLERPLEEHDPLGVHPNSGCFETLVPGQWGRNRS